HFRQELDPVGVWEENVQNQKNEGFAPHGVACFGRARGELRREARGFEGFLQIHSDRQTVVDDENSRRHVCLPAVFGRVRDASVGAISPSGRTRSAAPREMASLGIPKTTEEASSCAIVKPRARRIASKPSAPSRPIPVSRHARARSPISSAMDSKST